MMATNTMDNLLVYRDSYSISQLSTSDDGVMYECVLIVRGNSWVRVKDNITLDVTGELLDLLSAIYVTILEA